MAKEEKKERYTKYEVARLVGARALQIANGAPYLVKLTEAELQAIHYDPIKIAKQELDQGILPITVKRQVMQPHKKNELHQPAKTE